MNHFDWRKYKLHIAIGGGVLGVLLLVIILIAILSHKKAPVEEIPTIEPIHVERYSTVVEEAPVKPEYKPEPEPRDKYIHYESDPSRGDYNKIKRKDGLQLNNIHQDMLKSIINKIFADYRYTSCAYVYSEQFENSEVCWMKFDDSFWRFKYFYDTKAVTADGAMKDFAFATENDFGDIYRENSFEANDIDADIVISFIEYIYDQYQYTGYAEVGKDWYWDSDDKNNGALQSYVVQFTNSEYTDYWVFTYRCNNYVEAHRDITGSIQ